MTDSNKRSLNKRPLNNGLATLTPAQATDDKPLTFTYIFYYKSRPVAVANNVSSLLDLKEPGTNNYKHDVPNFSSVKRFANEEASLKYLHAHPTHLIGVNFKTAI